MQMLSERSLIALDSFQTHTFGSIATSDVRFSIWPLNYFSGTLGRN
jgi:hypothetical protein